MEPQSEWLTWQLADGQFPGTWLRTFSAQCCTARLKPSGNRLSPNTRPASSPITSPVTNLPMNRSTATGAPQLATHAFPTIGPGQVGEIMVKWQHDATAPDEVLAIGKPGVYCSGLIFWKIRKNVALRRLSSVW